MGWLSRFLERLRGATERTPSLLSAQDLAPGNIGVFQWDRTATSEILSLSTDALTVWWDTEWRNTYEKRFAPSWLGASTGLYLHSGHFAWDFVVDDLVGAQIGVGVMLLWDVGPDWGFFGYLGSSSSAWAYDPSTGDVVSETKSIHGGLGRFGPDQAGVVSVDLDIPRDRVGSLRFRLGGMQSPDVALPPGAVVQPAASLLAPAQRITLDNFQAA